MGYEAVCGWNNFYRKIESCSELEHFDCWIRKRLRRLL
ncbi:MAG: group II intron maturase-specific domain-containing protein [Endozoicomonas sp.]